MGWIRNDDDAGDGNLHTSHRFSSSLSSDVDHCTTRKVIKSHCRTEEIEPGKFLKKCEKIEEVFKDCVGRPTEVVQSNKEYTEEDVTHQMAKGSFSMESSTQFNFPGLRSDIEAIERNLFGGLDHFFKAAEEITNGFYTMFGPPGTPHISEGDSSPETKSKRGGIPIEVPKEFSSKLRNSDGDVDLSGLSKDV